MEKVLIVDGSENESLRLANQLSGTFAAKFSSASFRDDVLSILAEANFSLVVSDVEDSPDEGFWLHRSLRYCRPDIPLILLVSPDRPLRNVPQLDSTLRAAVVKPEYGQLKNAISRLGVLGAGLQS